LKDSRVSIIRSKTAFTRPVGELKEHVALLREQGLAVPPPVPEPKVTIQNAKTAAPVV